MLQTPGFFQEAFASAPVGMLVADASGVIVDVNRQVERLFGYPRDALLGQQVELLVAGDSMATAHRSLREAFSRDPHTRPMGVGRDLYGRHQDGHRVPVEIGLTALHIDGAPHVLACVVDLTERKHAAELLQSSLDEKEILLKELHHRAKNNLQLIASLLDLASSAPGPEVLAACRDRINSIALVHETLYQSGSFARIGLREYLETLAEQVRSSSSRPGLAPVEVHVDSDELTLGLDSAVPCGLIVNELLTNAVKHAFPGERGGTIVVSARQHAERLHLVVQDDGAGMPPGLTSREGHIGLDLVRALTRQLRGQVEFSGGPGTRVSLSFGVPS